MAIKIGIGNIDIRNTRSAFSWSRWWATQTDLLLFFGQIKNITGGQLNNEMVGSSDHLDVAGTAGSYTFQCPNNATYIAADTDYIWFKTDTTQRTTTEAELIGYDFPRTLVKYGNVSPYTLEWIAILKPAGVISNNLRDSFHLSIWWNNISSNYGKTKGNRTGEQSVYYDTDALALFARMGTSPSTALKALISKTFVDLKLANIYAVIAQFTKANIHNEDDAKLNWIGNVFPIVPVGSPVFTAKQGWACTTNKFLKSGFIPSIQISAGKIGGDDCGILLDNYLSAGDLGSYEIHGAFGFGDTTKRFQIATYSTLSPKCLGFLNDNTTGSVILNDDIASVNGVFYIERNNNVSIGYYNKIKSSEITMESSDGPNQELYFGALHPDNNSSAFFSNSTIRTIILCKYLGLIKQALLYDIIKYFNDNVGGTF